MLHLDAATHTPIADTAIDPLAGTHLSDESLASVREHYILSSSGWRGIFASDGDPESTVATISSEDTMHCGIMAYSFATFLQQELKDLEGSPSILVALDSRPTGPAMAHIVMRVLLSMGIRPIFTYIAAAPEAMAYSALSFDIDAFIYISASHNPVGYNGMKFGFKGSVLGPDHSARLIDSFLNACSDDQMPERILQLSAAAPQQTLDEVLNETVSRKDESLDYYRMFTGSVASGSLYICSQDQVFNTIHAYADTCGIGIVCDFNGSARTRSIDRNLLSTLGITTTIINDTPGVFAHRIVPEGRSLDQCRAALEAAYADDPGYLFGYVPDCDGDRGNIVYMDERSGQAKILEAQELFALCVLSELAYTVARTDMGQQLAVAVNGPTSMRIDAIAAVFGAQVFRAEVGEANVVQLAAGLRDQGYTVRILGEGSNGGNITHPAAVRDPLNTIFSLLKLITFRDQSDQKGLFRLWCERSGQLDAYTDTYSLSDIIETLPRYITTSAYEDRAVMHIATADHEQLKQRYEQLFAAYWEAHAQEFGKLGIASYQEFNTTGTQEISGSGRTARPDSSSGGLKIIMYDPEGQPTDFIWMRGSKTEPVFRILADCAGTGSERENWLLDLHRQLILEADRSH